VPWPPRCEERTPRQPRLLLKDCSPRALGLNYIWALLVVLLL
jgi:hypothetical protein